MRPILSIAIAAATVAASCSGPSSSVRPEVVGIDLRSNINIPDMGDLDSVFVIEDMIEPELTDSTMLKYAEVRGCRDNDLYIQEGNRLMIFDAADGRCLSSFDHSGEGPGEYLMLYKAWMSPSTGNWVGSDLSRGKILNYSPDGAPEGELKVKSLSGIAPEGDFWLALTESSGHIAVKSYDSDLNFIDSISTSITPDQYRAQYLFPVNGHTGMIQRDTIFLVDADARTVTPYIALNLGDITPSQEPKPGRLHYDTMIADNKLIIGYYYDGRNAFQIYDVNNGSLLYSRTCDSETTPAMELNAGDKRVKAIPNATIADRIYFTMIADDDDDDDRNPTLIRCRMR